MDVVAVVVSGALRSGPAVTDDLDTLAGVPVVARSVRGLVASGVVDRVLVLCPDERRPEIDEVVAGLPLPARAFGTADVPGSAGPPSQAHVGERAGTSEINGSVTASVLLVHDALRPLTPPGLAAEVVAAVRAGHPVAVPVLPLSDTVKQVGPDGRIEGTPDRAGLRVVQTPQGFQGDLVGAVLTALADGTTPECAYTAVPGCAHTVAGHAMAFPLRTAWDRDLAELLAGKAS